MPNVETKIISTIEKCSWKQIGWKGEKPFWISNACKGERATSIDIDITC